MNLKRKTKYYCSFFHNLVKYKESVYGHMYFHSHFFRNCEQESLIGKTKIAVIT